MSAFVALPGSATFPAAKTEAGCGKTDAAKVRTRSHVQTLQTATVPV